MPLPRFRFPFLKALLLEQALKRMAQPPRKPRHRALRLVLGVLGLGVLVVMIAFGVFVGLSMLVAGGLVRLWTLRRAPSADNALDGNYRVVRKPALPAR